VTANSARTLLKQLVIRRGSNPEMARTDTKNVWNVLADCNIEVFNRIFPRHDSTQQLPLSRKFTLFTDICCLMLGTLFSVKNRQCGDLYSCQTVISS
jgi:hypothetical protein